MPRLGKIRLGIRLLNDAKTHQYPKETKHFVCPPEVEAVFGKTPTELDIVFPMDSEAEACPQSYKWYQGPSLRCKGDGESALRVAGALGKQLDKVKGRVPADPAALVEISCPCPLLDKDEKGKSACNLVGTLSYMVPKVSVAGIYQTDIRSYNSILNINSALALTRSLIGRIAMVPFKLKRIPQEMQYQGKTTTHYILRLEHQLTLAQIQVIRGKQFMVGFDPAVPGADKTVESHVVVPPHIEETDLPEAEQKEPEPIEEDMPAGDPDVKIIEIFVTGVTSKESAPGVKTYFIKGQEVIGETYPILEFTSFDLEDAKTAWEMAKMKASVAIRYKIMPDGSFAVVSLDKGIPF